MFIILISFSEVVALSRRQVYIDVYRSRVIKPCFHEESSKGDIFIDDSLISFLPWNLHAPKCFVLVFFTSAFAAHF